MPSILYDQIDPLVEADANATYLDVAWQWLMNSKTNLTLEQASKAEWIHRDLNLTTYTTCPSTE